MPEIVRKGYGYGINYCPEGLTGVCTRCNTEVRTVKGDSTYGQDQFGRRLVLCPVCQELIPVSPSVYEHRFDEC